MWYIEKYQPDAKQPYLMAHLEDFAALRRMVTNQGRGRVEIVAPMEARTADTLGSCGHLQQPTSSGEMTVGIRTTNRSGFHNGAETPREFLDILSRNHLLSIRLSPQTQNLFEF
jgi:hypothetical protein